ncbi:M48 family metallopeptidase [Bacteriovorax sp. PP10]|uniref:M48 family metallopeptidase n=1 Tax=Bacteriovorax antarcticus TaxID=3088717 RepID=A0ABU5VT87_9BACT|nr:M48 family metallopeptidase [Bacteriovorax sp. PP10]MEA9355598.1 M48 family metallopeptidase [Bacteriovorax sp. PP10]
MDHIIKNRNTVPAKFQDQITLADHQKAADYSVEKIKVAQIFHFVDLVVFLVLTLAGGLELINHVAMGFNASPIMTGLIFFGAFGLIQMILSLPQTLYTTFVIEEKYGFNKTTWKTFVSDMAKGLALSLVLGAPIIYAILWIMERLGTAWWVYAFLFLTAVQLLIVFIYPTFIAPIFNKFSPLEEGEVKNKIIDLLTRCGFKSSGLFVMDASKRSGHGNAYFTGLGKNKRIVFFDTLLSSLDAEEVEAVLAHELGHMKRKHVLKGMIKGIVLSFVGFAILGYLRNNTAFFNGHGVQTITDYMALTLFSMVAGVYTFLLTPISAYTSRKYEYEADQFASENAQASKLITALVKMYKDNASSLTPDPLFSKFYFSHPPALERVTYLEELQKGSKL